MAPPPLWLTFFGIPALIAADGGETPLALRYRKGGALLAWLATRSARPQHRRAVAELFWPDLDPSAARANLRLVLNDLTKRLSALGLAEIVEVQPEWLTFRGGAHVVTDERWVADATLRALFPAHLTERAERVWCDLDGLDRESDFGEWLHAYRLWLAEQWSASHPTPEEALAPTQRSAGPEWRHLAILRVAFADEGLDERATLAAQHADFERLVGALRIHGATPAGVDAEGATFAFGLYARSGGFCRLALRAALTCLEEMPTARIGLTTGYLFVAPDENAFQGRRLLDAAHLARLADSGGNPP